MTIYLTKYLGDGIRSQRNVLYPIILLIFVYLEVVKHCPQLVDTLSHLPLTNYFSKQARCNKSVLEMILCGDPGAVNSIPANQESNGRLRKYMPHLLDNLHIDRIFIAHFVELNMLTTKEGQYIISETTAERNKRFVRVILAHGQLPYNVLKDVLLKTNQHALANKLAPKRAVHYVKGDNTSGRCLIICNQKFDGNKRDRTGADVDKHELKQLLHYHVEVKDNLKGYDILKVLSAESKHKDLEKAHAFVLIIMSHGKENIVKGTDLVDVSLKQVGDYFNANNCPALIDKPKAFIVQACQGATGIEGTGMVDCDEMSSSDEETNVDDGPIHQEADRVWAMATISGQKAYRDRDKGSWFICSLVKMIRKFKNQEHFVDILTKVCNEVANRTDITYGYTQLPEYRTTLRKKWYL